MTEPGVGNMVDKEKVAHFIKLLLHVAEKENAEVTPTEVSEITGIKPEYVDIILRLTSEIGVIEEKDGRFYVSEETRDAYDTVLTEIINSVP